MSRILFVVGLMCIGCAMEPPKPITGAFVAVQWANAGLDWSRELDGFPYDVLVLSRDVYRDRDPSRQIVAECSRRGIAVWLGLVSADIYEALPDAETWSDSAIVGWYVPDEIWGLDTGSAAAWNERMHLRRNALRAIKAVPVMVAPLPVGEDSWGWLLAGRPVDVVAIQDHSGASGLPPSEWVGGYRAIWSAARRNGVEVWGDVEAFDQAPDGKLVRTSRSTLTDRANALSPYCTRLIAWEWWFYMR